MAFDNFFCRFTHPMTLCQEFKFHSKILRILMKKRLRSSHQIIKTLLLLWFLFPFISCVEESKNEQVDLTTIVLVRHAEKVDDSSDPDLSEAGYERATNLAEMFENVNFDAVYSTDYIRTKETARPIADANGLTIMGYDYQNLSGEAENLIESHKGETILISGHSNTTPAFANAFLGEFFFERNFDESDYGNLLIITVSGDGKRKLLHLRY